MLQSTHRLILAGLIAFFVAAGVALTVVILVTRDNNGNQDNKASVEAFCWYVSFLVGSMGLHGTTRFSRSTSFYPRFVVVGTVPLMISLVLPLRRLVEVTKLRVSLVTERGFPPNP